MPYILHVEDNEGDILLTQEAFKASDINVDFKVAYDGQQAIDFFKNVEELPVLVLLDINMPLVNGKEVLRTIKEDDKLKAIPVIILTTSENAKDIEDCYDLYANAYVNKTIDFDSFQETIRVISEFWLKYNVMVNR